MPSQPTREPPRPDRPAPSAAPRRAPRSGVPPAARDRSAPAFGTHPSRTDRRRLTHADGVGYDLATVPIVRAADGGQGGPASVSLTTGTEVLTTQPRPLADVAHVDQVRGRMDFVAPLDLGAGVVHVIDREADPAGRWRDWPAAGHRARVRADDRLVRHDGRERELVGVAEGLEESGGLEAAGAASYRGREAWRFVGEARVELHRPAKRRGRGERREVPGDPVSLRVLRPSDWTQNGA